MIFWNRGIRIPHDKEPAASRGILPFSPAGPVLVPLCYGDTSEALPAAAAGAQIGRGEVLSDPGGDTPSLATVTGTFEDIRTISHPVVGQVSCAVLRPRPEENPPPPQPALLTAQEAEAAGRPRDRRHSGRGPAGGYHRRARWDSSPLEISRLEGQGLRCARR